MASERDFRNPETGGIRNYYEILSRGLEGVSLSPSSTSAQVRDAYRRQALIWHDDRHIKDTEEQRAAAQLRMKAINGAYQVLGNQDKKSLYDRICEAERARKAGGSPDGKQPAPGAYSYAEPPGQETQSHEENIGSRVHRVYANNVELPKEFAKNPTIINLGGLQSVIISDDGSKYATVNGGVHVYDMPGNGRVDFSGVDIHYRGGKNPTVEVTKTTKGWFGVAVQTKRTPAGGTIDIGKVQVNTTGKGGRGMNLEDFLEEIADDDQDDPINDPDLRNAINTYARYKRIKNQEGQK